MTAFVTPDVPTAPPRRASIPEIALVLGVPTSLFMASSVMWLVRGGKEVLFTDARIVSTLAIELVLAVILLAFLRRRGWTPGAVAGGPVARDAVRGIGVWLGCIASIYAVFAVVYLVEPELAVSLAAPKFSGTLSVPIAVAVSVVNPVFEEFLWLGYAIPALQSRVGLRAACVVSVMLRVAVHAYQGPVALITVLPTAIIFTVYFATTGRLWAVIGAHAIADVMGLAGLAMRGQ
jgi:membrane protease YdiL (CAAX protease family)